MTNKHRTFFLGTILCVLTLAFNGQQKMTLEKLSNKKLRTIDLERVDSVKTSDNKKWECFRLVMTGDSVNLYTWVTVDTIMREREYTRRINVREKSGKHRSYDSLIKSVYPDYIQKDTMLSLHINSLRQFSYSRVKDRTKVSRNFSGFGFVTFFVGVAAPIGAILSFIDGDTESGIIWGSLAIGTWTYVGVQRHRLSYETLDLVNHYRVTSN
jgi:hypothetical protein